MFECYTPITLFYANTQMDKLIILIANGCKNNAYRLQGVKKIMSLF